jgi:hypothetical protein
MSNDPNSIPTFIDSGANMHCIKDRTKFLKYEDRKMTGTMAKGGEAPFRIEGRGIAELAIRTGGKMRRFRFEAIHTPSFAMNLISLPTLDLAGFRGIWGDRKLCVMDPRTNDIILDGSLSFETGSHRLYRVDVVEHGFAPTATAIGAPSRNKPCGLAMWHCRFNHIDVGALKQMLAKVLVDGFVVTDTYLCGQCEVCIFAKMARRPFDEIVIPASEPLDRVSLDLWGRASVRSRGGAYYMFLIVDDGTSLMFPSFLSNKAGPTVLNSFSNWLAMAENQTGRKLKVARVDKGREFDNAEFFCILREARDTCGGCS